MSQSGAQADQQQHDTKAEEDESRREGGDSHVVVVVLVVFAFELGKMTDERVRVRTLLAHSSAEKRVSN